MIDTRVDPNLMIEGLPPKDYRTIRNRIFQTKAVVAKESMMDQTCLDISDEKKPFSLKKLFVKAPPLEDLGVPMVIISGIAPKYMGPLMEIFRQGVNKYVDSKMVPGVPSNVLIAFGVVLPNSKQK